MALPHSGPIVWNHDSPSLRWQRTGYRQTPPHTDVLYLRYGCGKVLSGLSNKDNTVWPAMFLFYVDNFEQYHSNFCNIGKNSAHEKFVSSVQDRAAIGVDVAEYSQSVDMIATAARKIGNIASAVRQKDLGKLIENLDPRGAPSFKKPTWKKAFADNFLQVHFGWVPLCQDLHDAAQVISNPLKSTSVTSRSHNVQESYAHYEDQAPNGSWYYSQTQTEKNNYYCKMGADVKVTNPALHLASQLGITNPLAIAWELVPFSFVVDWFANIGQFVAQLDEFAGLGLVNPYTTIFIRSSFYKTVTNYPYWPATEAYTGENACVTRTSGIDSVSLSLKPLKLPSPTRAVTAVSLLIQQLSR